MKEEEREEERIWLQTQNPYLNTINRRRVYKNLPISEATREKEKHVGREYNTNGDVTASGLCIQRSTWSLTLWQSSSNVEDVPSRFACLVNAT